MSNDKAADFHTQAGNFAEAVAGSVDPRTGLYGAVLTLGHLVGNDHLGPQLPLALRYSPLVRRDIGFGIGMTLGLSTFDADASVLHLSTGEQYQVERRGDDYRLRHQALEHLRVDVVGGQWRIVHKSGDTEFLDGPGQGGSLKMTRRLVTAAGHALHLDWDAGGEAGVPRLQQVKDDRGQVLLRIDRSRDRWEVLPGCTEGYTLTLEYEERRLHRITSDAAASGPGDAPLAWVLEYTPLGVWGQWLSGVVLPGGLHETVTYSRDDRGHAFPSDSHGEVAARLPYVVEHSQRWQGAELMHATYGYAPDAHSADHNFLGGALQQADGKAPDDDVFDSAGGYLYGSEQTLDCEGMPTVITRLYNKFHLQVLEQTTTGSGPDAGTVATWISYPNASDSDDPRHDPGQRREQPPQFQLPRRRRTQWLAGEPAQRKSGIEEVRSTFDEAGNPKRQIEADGTQTDWEYYPARGEDGACPADPHGFVRYLRRVTVTPAVLNGLAVPAQITEYRYEKLAIDAGAYAVVKAEERHYSQQGERRQLLRRHTYAYDTTGPDRGRLRRHEATHYPEGEDKPAYTTTQTFACQVEGEALKKTHTLRTYDSKELTRTQTRSRFTGRLWEETDAAGLRTQITYDRLGRERTHTVNPKTEYAHTRTTDYALLSAAQQREVRASFQVEMSEPTDGGTRRVRQDLDGVGRVVSVAQQQADRAQDDNWYVVRQQRYDSLGRLQYVKLSDWRFDQGEPKAMSTTQTIAYDEWGWAKTVTTSSGGVRHSRHDPIERTHTTWLAEGTDGTGSARTHRDAAGRVTQWTRLDAKQNTYSTRTVQYDGLGQVRVITDELGHMTRYDYDAWGRVIQVTLPDETVITRSYAPESAEARVTGITVQGKGLQAKSLGTQTFDGLGRLKRRTEGGRERTYDYARDADRRPQSETGPDGFVHTYGYIRELGEALAQRQAGEASAGLTQTFEYSKLTGALKLASAGQMVLAPGYYPSGRLKTQTVQVDGQSRRSEQFSYTLGGQLQTCTDFQGVTQTLGYDDYGRLAQLGDADAQMGLDYDALGRSYQWTARNPRTDHTLRTTLTLDDFGREAHRELRERRGSATTIWTIRQDWYPNDRLASRTTSRDGNVLRNEQYTYDKRGRLASYTCTGAAPPVDAYGHAIASQTFIYDAHDNITQCVSRFADRQADTATYRFENDQDVHQLTGVEHTHPDYRSGKFRYDAAGRLKEDESGRTFDYDALGRLASVKVSGRTGLYGYDALDRLVTQQAGQAATALYYRGDSLACTIAGQEAVRLSAGAQVRTGGPRAGTWLTGSDTKGSPVVVSDGQTREEPTYTAYGDDQAGGQEASVLGYNGERVDALLGAYHLGNGYRAYRPGLMRFTAPDSWSPFGAGGLNPYAYCAGDPVNRADPSGHLSWQAIVGIVGGAVGILLAPLTFGASLAATTAVATVFWGVVGTLEVISGATAIASGALEEKNPEASAILGWVSLGTGLPSMGTGFTLGAYRGYRALSRATSGLRLRLGNVREAGLSGRGAPQAGAAMANQAAESARGVGRPEEYLWAERQILIHDYMEHHFMRGNPFAMESRGRKTLNGVALNFDDVVLNAEYRRDRWAFHSAYREAEVLPPFWMSDVAEYQYFRISTRNKFYGNLPNKISSMNIQNDKTISETIGRTGNELREAFLNRTPVGRFAKRRADSFGLEIIGIERTEGEYGPNFDMFVRSAGLFSS